MYGGNAATNMYQQNSVSIESPEKLIEMLYEGILKFCSLAKKSIEKEDIEKKIYYINRASAIFSELINSLDYDGGGEVAHYLSGLYTHQLKLLTEANAYDDTEKVDTVLSVAKGLLEAWREINEDKLG
ncbi:MAG: flagellar export chaperone FliS [Campylobacterales bacterium]